MPQWPHARLLWSATVRQVLRNAPCPVESYDAAALENKQMRANLEELGLLPRQLGALTADLLEALILERALLL